MYNLKKENALTISRTEHEKKLSNLLIIILLLRQKIKIHSMVKDSEYQLLNKCFKDYQ